MSRAAWGNNDCADYRRGEALLRSSRTSGETRRGFARINQLSDVFDLPRQLPLLRISADRQSILDKVKHSVVQQGHENLIGAGQHPGTIVGEGNMCAIVPLQDPELLDGLFGRTQVFM